jgi:RNA 3'-terminal phosphate cyclase (ATP)
VLEIDGSKYSGSGTLLRYSVALATLLSSPLHMTHIRANREKPGLRPQHLQALRACSSLSGGEIQGGVDRAKLPSTAIPDYVDFRWILKLPLHPMLAFTLIPLALFAKGPSFLP